MNAYADHLDFDRRGFYAAHMKEHNAENALACASAARASFEAAFKRVTGAAPHVWRMGRP